ncbi:MAG: phosphodiester glycosidase family protein, partial [Candidatus Sumerlaeaceae bacterium]|nr:phosphodiester glycosidase family protein [Candidatus Sumerlaeaceae bacterium]
AVDLTTSGSMLTRRYGKGRLFTGATVEEMARAAERPDKHVLGAVNSDFWKNSPGMFTPVNLYVTEGMAARLPVAPAPRAVFGHTTDGKYFIKPLTAYLRLTINNRTVSGIKLNEPITSSGVVLFNRHFGRDVSLARYKKAYRLDLGDQNFLPNQRVVAKVAEELQCTTVSLSGNSLVLALHGNAHRKLGQLKTGSIVTIELKVPEVKGVIDLAVGGSPLLLQGGKPHIDWQQEKLLRSFVVERHPRTAVGLSRDGTKLYIVTVDGRQPALSIGMTLYELSLYLRELGSWDAMNFDGGGSTTMVVRGDVVNKPSDRLGPRSVVNSLLVVLQGLAGPLAQLELSPRQQEIAIPCGAKEQVRCRGRDALGNSVTLDPELLKWEISPPVAELETSGTECTIVAREEPSTGVLRMVYAGKDAENGLEKEVPVRIVALTSATVEPSPLVLSQKEEISLNIQAVASDMPFSLSPHHITLSPSNDCLTVTKQRVRGMKRGEGCLTVSLGRYKMGVPYYVEEFSTVTLCSFDAVTTRILAGTRFDKKFTYLRLNQQKPVEGRGCLAWRYAMTKGGTSRIILPLDVEIPGKPAKISLAIHGDGKEAWLRAEVVDAVGNRFLLDFTNGSTGITWKNEWRRVTVALHTLVPRPANPGAKPVYPLRVSELYLAQDQEALKAQGEILLDALEAVYAPDTSSLKCTNSNR